MKKVNIMVVIILLIIIIVGVTGTIILLSNKRNDKTNLSVLDEIIFSDEEKEILEVLRKINEWLLNPETEKDEDTNVFSLKPAESICLKDFVTEIYEVRKRVSVDDEPYYILDVDTRSKDNKTTRRFFIYSNSSVIVGLNESDFDWSDMAEEKVEQTESGEITMSFGSSFYQAMLESFNQQIEEEWNNAEKFNQVNYNALLKAI